METQWSKTFSNFVLDGTGVRKIKLPRVKAGAIIASKQCIEKSSEQFNTLHQQIMQ